MQEDNKMHIALSQLLIKDASINITYILRIKFLHKVHSW